MVQQMKKPAAKLEDSNLTAGPFGALFSSVLFKGNCRTTASLEKSFGHKRVRLNELKLALAE